MKRIVFLMMIIMMLFSASYAIDNCVEITNVSIERLSENKAIISYKIKNITNKYQSDIYPIISIRKLSEEGAGYTEIIKTYETQKISLYPNESQYVVSSLKYPDIIPEGYYAIYIEVNTRTYIAIPATFVSTLPIYGNGDFSVVPDGGYSQSHYWTTPTDALTGPTYNINESPVAKIHLHSNEDTILIPEVTVYKRSSVYLEEPVSVTRLEPVILKANENKIVQLKMPAQSESDSYLAKVVFIGKEKKQRSYEYFFRYVVKGENAKIINLSPSFNSEKDMMDIEISFASSADSSKLKNSTISYFVYENDKLILNKEEKIEEFSDVYVVNDSVSYIKDREYRIKALISKDNKVFDEYTVNVPKNFNITPNKVYFLDTIGTYYEESAKILSGLKFISGYPDSTFKPKNNITRAEMIVIASRLFDKKSCDLYVATTDTFSDTSKHWARNYIEYGVSNGIVSGYPDGTFKPDANVSYQEAITILINTIGRRNTALSSGEQWPNNYINLAYRLNITYKMPKEMYTTPAIRGEIADMTLHAFLRKED